MRFDLRVADGRVKWLVTCLLATLGIAYVFGAWMVALYAGFTLRSVAATYAQHEPRRATPPESTVVMEHAMTLADFDETTPHRVDLDLLIQDTHVHVPMYALIAALLSAIVLGLGLGRRTGYALITLLFAAPVLDFAGMWLTKLASPHYAVVTLIGGWAMGLGYTIVTAVALWRMWGPGRLGGEAS